VVVYTGLALFAGAGGLELGLKLALGDRYKCVAFVERSAEAASVLATQMERGWLDKAPIWDDVTTFTGDVVSPFVDNIDIISAGFPCQPWSVAGSRRKTDDDRWLWPHIFRLVREIRPRSIFLENVPGLLHGGIEHVLGDLASLGFSSEWTCLRASDVGAPHRRERVFILANSSNLSGQVSPSSRADGTSGAVAAGASGELGNADESRLEGWQQPVGQRAYERPSWPPSPSDTDAWAEVLRERPDLAPAVGKSAEQGLPKRNRERVSATGTRDADFECTGGRNRQETPESEVRGVADGVARRLDRTAQLRILGNGVVPQQAALAFQILKERN